MSKVFFDVGVSLDGYIAGPNAGPRNPLGDGTTFFFVTEGIAGALGQARAAAGSKDVRVSGGAATIRQFIEAGLIDEFTLHIAPVLLGSGVRLLDHLGPRGLEPEQLEVHSSPLVTHISYRMVRSEPKRS